MGTDNYDNYYHIVLLVRLTITMVLWLDYDNLLLIQNYIMLEQTKTVNEGLWV